MEKKAAPSLAAESIPICTAPADIDRRRLVRIATGSALLFAVALVFGLGFSRPDHYAGQSNYALAAGTAAPFRGDSADLPTEAVGLPPPSTSDTTKRPAAEQPGSTVVSKPPSPAEARAAHDTYCNLYAAAVTGNVTPEQASQREQAHGAIVGALGGAVLGAMFGSSGRHSGRSSIFGASAGLLAGAAVGSSNARLAAEDVRKRLAEAYATCMNQKETTGTAQPGS